MLCFGIDVWTKSFQVRCDGTTTVGLWLRIEMQSYVLTAGRHSTCFCSVETLIFKIIAVARCFGVVVARGSFRFLYPVLAYASTRMLKHRTSFATHEGRGGMIAARWLTGEDSETNTFFE